MTLQNKLSEDLQTAMKAKDSERTSAIRILIGEFARQPKKDLSDEEVIAIAKKLIKAERELLAAKEQEQNSPFIDILKTSLPHQASEEDIRRWIEENVDLENLANRMQAMKPIMSHFGSGADGNLVKKVLNSM
jgi:uncharacterized protein YqeY